MRTTDSKLLLISLTIVFGLIAFLYFQPIIINTFSNEPQAISDNDFQFMGIFPGELLKKELVHIVGQPLQFQEKSAEYGILKFYKYQEFEIITNYYDNKEIINLIQLTGKNVMTNRGIKVGDSEKKLLQVYGYKKKDSSYYSWSKWPDDSFSAKHIIETNGELLIQFKIENACIKTIEYYIALD